MIKCQACGTQNLDGSQYCDECGDSLVKYQAPLGNASPQNEPESSAPPDQGEPIFKSASVTSVGIPQVVENKISDGASEGNDEKKTSVGSVSDPNASEASANLVIDRGSDIGRKFPIAADESNIGRWDADNGVFPDIDLDAHDPEAKVSRKHARIIFRNGEYLLEDLGSTNGTFINRGRRLIPGAPQKLSEGDEIIVGKTFLRFHIG
ncbi:MAG: FHA domain-containing protein [Pyrinomonadaceae bacterium]|nr:FHA domain-containing protein [Pyrinomonadaceae bacterium]